MMLLGTLLLLSSCSITVPNIKVCRDRDGEGFCVETLSAETEIIPEEEWPQIRETQFHIFPAGWEKLKVFILKACSLEQVTCKDEEVEKQIALIEGKFLSE